MYNFENEIKKKFMKIWLTTKYRRIGDKKKPPKCPTKVVTTLVGRSACASWQSARLEVNGGGIQ